MITISGGNFQDAEGNVLASGRLKLQLGFDAQYSASSVVTGIIAAGSIITITLDVNGNAPSTQIVSNAEMLPSGNYYRATLYTANGQAVFAYPQIWIFTQTTGQSVNLNTIIPQPSAPVFPGAAGSVTSVGLSMPAEFTVTGTPVISSGTLAVAKANQSANQVYAGPASGGAAAPGFRAVVPADMPIFVASGASHASGAVPDPGASPGTTRFLREDASFAVPPSGATTGQSIVPATFGAPISIATGWQGFSLCLKIANRQMLCFPQSWKASIFPAGATVMTIQKAVVYTTLADSLVITAVNTMAWGGVSSNFTLNGGTEALSDAVAVPILPSNDYYLVFRVATGTVNTALNGYNINSLSGTATAIGAGNQFMLTGGYVNADETGLIVGNSVPASSFTGTQCGWTRVQAA